MYNELSRNSIPEVNNYYFNNLTETMYQKAINLVTS